MKTALLATALLALPLATVAQESRTPQPDESARRSSFDALDSNKDGRISMPEASADPRLVETFSSADKNGDGYLDSAEYARGTAQPQR